ncbi:MAG TPA: FIVAR domain-containing protein [Candidatus Mediterraneibacter merdigallinarum]|nr:FIVAR domain-containing protein [Candidatus Mediterraneibacter merdigallinarum]
MKKGRLVRRRGISLVLSAAMVATTLSVIPAAKAEAAPSSDEISNSSLTAEIGDLGQISSLTINNNQLNNQGKNVNFVLPNDSANQNNTAHQWMGEMIFSYRTSEDGTFPEGREGFVEVDTNRTLAAGGSTTYSDASENLESNPYIEKKVEDDKVEITFKGQDLDSTDERTMKGFDVQSVFDMGTEDGSMLWSITLENTSDEYIEFGDVGLPMPWNNKYGSVRDAVTDTYNNRMTVHTYAGADSGYAYAIRCSGEGNYMMFTPVPETGARIEYIDQWIGSVDGGMNGVQGTRNGPLYANWTSDTGGWFPGLQVYYIHSKDIQKTGRGYYTDATSLVLEPGEEKTYQFKFSAVRAGDNTPQDSADDHNNASDSVEERENNQRSILYDSGMIDAVAVPGFQTAINMPTKLDLHYDENRITDVNVEIQCVHENDPWDEAHIPEQGNGLVNNSKVIEHSDTDKATLAEAKQVDGEWHHIYNLNFGCIGNNSVRVEYKLDGEEKFTQFEFNVLEKLDETIDAHSDFMVENTQDNDPNSETYGIYSDWYISSGKDTNQRNHWADDWSHDNIDFMTMKNYLDPESEEVESIERYLIDFMWDRYMKNSQESFVIADWLRDSSIYGGGAYPYSRDYAEMMVCTGFFNMYRIEKAYPDLIDYRQPAEWYLDKAYNIYMKTIGAGNIGFYGEQQVPQMIEALKVEGMTEESADLQQKFAKTKGTAMATAAYPYGSEFEYDNTGEEGAYAAAKALREYYPDDANVDKALSNMERAEWKTRAMRGLQPTWYHYADPVFRGGESWWNFQYTASLAGSIMDDWLRYEDNGWDVDSSAWAQRMNYAAKISNFNSVNMGQISDKSIGATSWRYTSSKGGLGAQDVYDYGTRIMNNGWNDFSGESEEGLYGSLLRISADVATDPVFGLTGYGAEVSKDGSRYTVIPLDGIGKRINIIDNKIYVELEQDSCTTAVIDENGAYIDLTVNNTTGTGHLSKITLSGAGIEDGYYSVKVNGQEGEQCYVSDNEGIAYAVIPRGESAQITIEKMDGGENQAPKIYSVECPAASELHARLPFRIESTAYDDGAPDGTLSYKWEVTEAPEGGSMVFDADDNPYVETTADKAGEYRVKLTVSDGEKSAEQVLVVTMGDIPEKTAPVINELSAEQELLNNTLIDLKVDATADSFWGNDLSYEWEVVSQPEGGNAAVVEPRQTETVVKVFTPGTYTFGVTITDSKTEDKDTEKVTYREISVETSEEADGVEHYGEIITNLGKAPELPATMDIIYPDATVKESTIIWDEIPEASYAERGEFTVEGTVEGTDMKATVNVIVVTGEAKNIAMSAEPSGIIDDVGDGGGVATLNDGYEPETSRDRSHGMWHNWHGDNSSDAWVQYTWNKPVTIYQSNAYYYTDGNFVPREVWYEYLDENGEWMPIQKVEGCGNELDQYNVTTFNPVTTTAIRMNMSPLTQGCGVIEWQIIGYGDQVVDKNLLKRTIDRAEALDLDLFAADETQLAELQAAIDEAQSVYDDAEAIQEEVDMAAAKLARVIATLPTIDGNLSYSATTNTSYVSTWETLDAVNDGQVPENSYNPAIPRYGTYSYDRASDHETVTYTWNSQVTLKGADLYLWYDGEEPGNYTGGGIKIPTEYYYEYLDSEGNWQKVENPSEYGLEMDKFNTTTFDEVTTTSIRVTLMKQDYDMNGIGIMEWKVYGQINPADKTALDAAITDADIEDGSIYTEESWAAFTEALENAKEVVTNEKASQAEVDAALALLVKAQNNLEVAPEDKNIAPIATASGICNYDGQDGRPYDQGGLPKMNDQIEPTSSSDLSNGAWFNWNDRYDDNGDIQNAWVAYTWDEPVILESTDVYYFTDGGGHKMPKSVTFEYLNDVGEWVELTDVTPGCEADQYNTTKLGNIRTTALRMTMEPQFLNDGDPACGVGVIEWKVNGFVAPDKTALEDAIAAAEELKEDDYTASSWKTLEIALEEAKAVAEDEAATPENVEDARKALERAINALVGKDEKPLYDNIAPDAATDGICNYDGQDGRPNDLGGLAALNDGYEPTESHDTSHAVWHNWQDRYENGIPQDAWVSYTWDKPVEISSMDIYYFADYGGIVEPESISIEYLNEDGEWVAAEEAQDLSCVLEEYNTVKLANIKTTAIRMTLKPQFLSDSDPSHGVGILEWKVYGKYVDETEVVKDALNAAIEEAEKRVETDYTADSWANFARALENAKIVAADENADQTAVDEATALLNEAMGALVAAEPPADVDRTALEALIAEAEGYNRTDYTEESWAVFAEALTNAYSVDQNVEATQDDVDKAAEALQAAIDGLEEVHADVNLEEIRALIDEALQIQNDGYTAESWDALQDALVNAALAVSDPDVTQEQIDQLAAALRDAIDALEEAKEEADLDAINALIDVAQKLNESDYTADSWKALEDALADAVAAAEDAESTQAQIDKAAAALVDAITGLKAAEPAEEVNLAAINALINVAQRLDKDNYTAESWNALQDALAAALAAAEDPEATQDQIDKAAAALGDAIVALEIAQPGEDPGEEPGENPNDKPGQTPDGNNGSGNGENGNSGSGADGEQNNEAAVQTGDNSPIMVYGVLVVIAAAGIICIIGMRKRRR